MKFSIVLLVTYSLMSCSRAQNLEDKIHIKVNECSQDSCVIKIKDLTNFDWDSVYFFSYFTPLESIESIIGQPYKHYQEFTIPIIFKKNDSIVYFENNACDVEGIKEGQVIIGSESDTLNCKIFTQKTAVFNARKISTDKVEYYKLIPLSN